MVPVSEVDGRIKNTHHNGHATAKQPVIRKHFRVYDSDISNETSQHEADTMGKPLPKEDAMNAEEKRTTLLIKASEADVARIEGFAAGKGITVGEFVVQACNQAIYSAADEELPADVQLAMVKALAQEYGLLPDDSLPADEVPDSFFEEVGLSREELGFA